MGGGVNDGKILLLVVGAILAAMLWLAWSNVANALPVEVRYRNPLPTVAHDRLDVCRATGCTTYPAPCAPGASCAVTASLPAGVHEAWLVGRAGALVSPASNRRTLTLTAPAGCEWDLDGSGGVNTADFGLFYTRWSAGQYKVADFGRFLVAYTTAPVCS